MKHNKYIIITIGFILSPILFSGCGGSSDNDAGFTKKAITTTTTPVTNDDLVITNTPTSDSPTITKVDVVNCGVNNFTTIQSGDVLVSPSSSSIDLRHLSDGTKKVCVLSGSAYIER